MQSYKYACTCLMRLFRGILVALVNFDIIWKGNMKCIAYFNSSLVVSAYQATFLKCINKLW